MRLLLFILLLWFQMVVSHADDADSKGAASSPEATETTDFQLEGEWKPAEAVLRGVSSPPSALRAIKLTIEDDKYEVTVEGEEHADRGSFTLDESVTPKRITIKSMSGVNEGKTLLAIYESKGADAMRICFDLSGEAFPTAFKAPEDSDCYLVDYRRQEAMDSEKNQNHGEPQPASESTDQ